jgi:hypothetical protein
MKKKVNKALLAIILSVACGLLLIATSLIIYDYVSNDVQSSSEQEDDGWTDNY